MGTSEATWTEDDIGDQSGRVALITGANSGIGFEAARALAQHGAHVVLACRNAEKAAEAEVQINALDPSGSVEVLVMDLGDLESVAEAADAVPDAHDRLDLLVNNAGLMATPRGTTAQGFETQFGVNHLGHFALTAHLLRRSVVDRGVAGGDGQQHGPPVRAASTSMISRARAAIGRGGRTCQSKLANLLFTIELQRRLEAAGSSTIAVAAHPGRVEHQPRPREPRRHPQHDRVRGRTDRGPDSCRARRWARCRRCGPRSTPTWWAATISGRVASPNRPAIPSRSA